MGIVNDWYKELVSLEYLMANPNISYAEMLKIIDKKIKEIKGKYNHLLWIRGQGINTGLVKVKLN